MYNRNIACDIIEKLGVLSTSKTGYTKEVRIVSWNKRDARLEIRMGAK